MKRISLALILVFIPHQVFATPDVVSVSGTITTGQSITLSGSSFGSHSLQVESLQSNIEEGTVGNRLSKSGWDALWDTDWAGPVYSTTQKHSGSKSLYSNPNADGLNWQSIFSFDMPNVGPGQRFYATWWVRFSGSQGGQWKMFRASGNKTIEDATHELVLFNWWSDSHQMVVDPGTSNDQTGYLDQNNYPARDGAWYRVELDVVASSANVANGSATVRRTSDTGTITTFTYGNIKTHINAGDTWGHAIWQNYVGNPGMSGAQQIYFDDVYVQYNTPARVEMCSGSTWNTRGKCEVQVPTSWGASSIVATVNTGNFANDAVVYLYVVDSAGTANSSGREIAVSSTQSGTPVNGACGSNHGATFSSLTSGDINNCSAGTVSGFTGTGPWSWTCAGLNGGSNSSTCSASGSGYGLRISAGSMPVGVGTTAITPIQ